MNPCRYCTDRTEDCHGNCQKYIDWKKENDEARLKEWEQKWKYIHSDRYMSAMIRRRKK